MMLLNRSAALAAMVFLLASCGGRIATPAGAPPGRPAVQTADDPTHKPLADGGEPAGARAADICARPPDHVVEAADK
uniref:hypothetical protein n=1 Tax=Tahibacter caeni TaxID=1453545 RepID=UPI00214960D7